MSEHTAIVFRNATENDLVAMVALLAQIERSPDLKASSNDMTKDLPSPVDVAEHVPSAEYVRAFEEICRDEHTDLVVGIIGDVVVAMLQITYIAGLSLRGTKRALVEDVRVASVLRGQGVGRSLMEHAIMRAIEHECNMIQLTTNAWREDAIAFYKGLGMRQTHVGLRMQLHTSDLRL